MVISEFKRKEGVWVKDFEKIYSEYYDIVFQYVLSLCANEEKLYDSDTAFQIHRVLHILDEPYKEVFWMRTFGELSFKDIGVLFDKSESWARVTYYRTKIKIKESIK